jgi:integrase
VIRPAAGTRLVHGNASFEPPYLLFKAKAGRYWLLRSVQRICKEAGVPIVPAHGLRGTHATLAVDAGATSHLVAAALGHESFSTTARHYARAEAIEGAQQNRVLEKFTVVHGRRSSPSRAA